jgi:hypothetical protein
VTKVVLPQGTHTSLMEVGQANDKTHKDRRFTFAQMVHEPR